MGMVIEICAKYPGGPTRNRGTDMATVLVQYYIIRLLLVYLLALTTY